MLGTYFLLSLAGIIAIGAFAYVVAWGRGYEPFQNEKLVK